MRAYSLLTIQTCHKRNAPAIGGMAAQIPVKNDEAKNKEAYEKVRNDKLREVKDGHDAHGWRIRRWFSLQKKSLMNTCRQKIKLIVS